MKQLVYLLLIFQFKQLVAQENAIYKTDYFKKGKAEVSVYKLEQNRYQDQHPGTLVSIFVTEDFLTDKQVKNETYQNQNSTWILKNIQLRKFATGVYDYSLFTSVFTPIDRKKFPNSLKVSASSQEWCGTIFTQLNLDNQHYIYQQNSYFEKEGDVTSKIEKAFLEDEIFTVLRMNPQYLPTGNFKIIPSLNFSQLKHFSSKPFLASGKLEPYKKSDFKGEQLMSYQFEIKELQRTFVVVFENKAPYKIVGFTDTFPSAFDKKRRTTKAVLHKQIMLDYWSKNSLGDLKLRKELELD